MLYGVCLEYIFHMSTDVILHLPEKEDKDKFVCSQKHRYAGVGTKPKHTASDY